jgi:small subunit ribosomal protein S20
VQKLGLDNPSPEPRRTAAGTGRPEGSFSRPERQKILKKGLILSRQGVIMRICMENEQKEVESMPNIKSSKKDVISSKIAYEKNKADKSELKTNLKKFDAALVSGDKAAADVAYKTAVKAVDQAVNKGLLHKNNAARKKSSMTLKLNKLA